MHAAIRHLALPVALGLAAPLGAQAQTPDSSIVYCDSTLEASVREADLAITRAVTPEARHEASRLSIQASNRARAERVRRWRERNPGVEERLTGLGVVLAGVSCEGYTTFIRNL